MGWTFNPFTGAFDYFSSSGGGSATFDALTDTPSNKTGSGGKLVAVNAGETALEFVSAVQAFDGGNYADTYVNTVDFDAGSY